MILNQEDSIILVIDVQEKLVNAIFNKDIVIKNSINILKAARILNMPIFITEQYPQGLGESIEGIKNGDAVYIKTAFNALEDKKLLENLRNTKRKQIIIFGVETHICVHQTAEELIKKGFEVTVISDACGSRSEYQYELGLANIKQNGAFVKTTEMVLFELIKSAKHPNFKEIQALIK